MIPLVEKFMLDDKAHPEGGFMSGALLHRLGALQADFIEEKLV